MGVRAVTWWCLMCVFRASLGFWGLCHSPAPPLIGHWPLSFASMTSHLGTFHSQTGLSDAAAGEIAFLFPYNSWSESEMGQEYHCHYHDNGS